MYKHLLRLIVDYNGFVDWLHWYFLFQKKKKQILHAAIFLVDFIPCYFFVFTRWTFFQLIFQKFVCDFLRLPSSKTYLMSWKRCNKVIDFFHLQNDLRESRYGIVATHVKWCVCISLMH